MQYLEPNGFIIPEIHWILELLLLVFLFLLFWICICVRSIRYFWKFPMPARMGNVIAAGFYRNRVQPLKMIVESIEAHSGMITVEIGCGSGFYTVEMAKAIQPGGILYVVDIQEAMLEKLQK